VLPSGADVISCVVTVSPVEGATGSLSNISSIGPIASRIETASGVFASAIAWSRLATSGWVMLGNAPRRAFRRGSMRGSSWIEAMGPGLLRGRL